ncbi:cytochrome P450 71A12 [Citrus sinensis]|uniref:cytochrome P450 71A1-like n=1 Tax=Citrus sinensis TaxID=2711 RepID=UPI00218E4B29|nr:cytochrome P450 71A1-like [Citrus sinensis]KAH9722813.1 cytochrome P450 71A12 [Citrus sinensis]
MALVSVLMKQLLQPFMGISEIYNPPLSIFLLLLILLLTLVQLLKITRRSSNHLNLPPSPPKLPILGNLHQLLGTLPHRSLKALSERYGPLMFVYFGNSPTFVVSSAELAGEMFKTHDIVISNRPKTTPANILVYECQDITFSNYGEYWRQARKICILQLLSVRRVQSFQYVRDDEVSSLVTKIRLSCLNKGGPLNLTEMLLTASSNIVSLCVLGKKADEEEENIGDSNKLGELSRRLEEQLAAFCMGDMFPSLAWLDVLSGFIGRLNATARAFDALLDQVIEEHTNKVSKGSGHDDDQSDKKDFVDILLQLRKDGMLGAELSQDNLKAIILDMFVAGTETTATTLEWAMAELVKNPTSMNRVREEVRSVAKGKLNIDMKEIEKMDYLKCVVKETLRLHPPVPLLVPREMAESIKWRGYDIPAKTRVIVNAWAIQTDPQVWDRPEDFLPDRFFANPVDCKGRDFQFIPFGAGRRGCPGISFALAAVEYVMANLLYWFDWNLPLGEVEENLDMSEVNGLVVHKKLPLHLVPTLYSPCS